MLDDKKTDALRQELGLDAFAHLAETFFSDFKKRLSSLERHVRRENREALEFDAYTAFGSAANIGLSALAHEAGVVVQHSRHGEWGDIKASLSRMRHAALASVDSVNAVTGRDLPSGSYPPFTWEVE